MKKFILATTISFALPIAAFAQSSSGAMADPTTSANPSPTMGTTTPKMVTPSMTASLSATDKTFIKMAAVAGLAEVSDGHLAEQKGDASVKQIGAKMVADHGKANDQLTDISQRLDAPAPTQTDARHMQMSAALHTKSGAAFDTAYLQDELTGHEKTIALFKKEISSGSNPQLKDFAQTTLPILEGHLSMVKSALQS